MKLRFVAIVDKGSRNVLRAFITEDKPEEITHSRDQSVVLLAEYESDETGRKAESNFELQLGVALNLLQRLFTPEQKRKIENEILALHGWEAPPMAEGEVLRYVAAVLLARTPGQEIAFAGMPVVFPPVHREA